MTNTPQAYEQYAATHLSRPQGGPWAGPNGSFCVELVFYCGGFSRSFATATAAGDYVSVHHGLDPDWTTAQPGEFDYWSNHIAMRSSIHPNYDLMASDYIPAGDELAPGLGYQTPTGYGIPSGHGMAYRGHSPYFGDQTLNVGTSIAGVGNVTPITAPSQGEHDMYVIEDAGVSGANVGTGALYIASDQGFAPWPGGKFPNDRAVLTKALGQIVSFSTGDLATVKAAFLLGAGAVTAGITDAQLAALATAIAADIVLPTGITPADEQAWLASLQAAIIAKIPTHITETATLS